MKKQSSLLHFRAKYFASEIVKLIPPRQRGNNHCLHKIKSTGDVGVCMLDKQSHYVRCLKISV